MSWARVRLEHLVTGGHEATICVACLVSMEEGAGDQDEDEARFGVGGGT